MTLGAGKARLDIPGQISAGGATSAPTAGAAEAAPAPAGGQTTQSLKADNGATITNPVQIGAAGDVTIYQGAMFFNGVVPDAVKRIWLQKDSSPTNVEFVTTVTPGQRVYLGYTLNLAVFRMNFKLPDNVLIEVMITLRDAETSQAIDSASLPLLWQGELSANDLLIPYQFPDPLPSGVARLSLEQIKPEKKLAFIDSSDVTLKGNWVPAEPLKTTFFVETPEPLPSSAACLHIYPVVPAQPPPDARPRYNMICILGDGERHAELEQTLDDIPSCVLSDEQSATKFIGCINALSRDHPEILTRLKDRDGGVMVFDFAGTGAPWESLDFGERSYLSAHVPISRWLRLSKQRVVKLLPEPLSGPVLSLGPLPWQMTGWEVIEKPTATEFWERFFDSKGRFSVVYVGNLPAEVANLEDELGFFQTGEIEGPRPLFILGYPGAAQVTYAQRVAGGLVALLLKDVATGVIGLAGQGQQSTVEQLLAATIERLVAGTPVGDALRQARYELIAAWKPGRNPRVELATALLLHYYGSPFLTLELPQQAEGGGT